MSDVVTCECGRQWTGLAECHCMSCHRHFASDLAFQAHVKDGICRDPTGLKDAKGRPRFRIIYRRDGVLWQRADYRADRNFGARRQAPRTVAATRHHRIVSSVTLTRRAPRRRSVA